MKLQLLKEGNLVRYFGYAIGEIVFVAVGILIAFQVDSWNEQCIVDRSIQNHLSSLRQDLLQDQDHLKELVQNMTDNIRYADSSIMMINTNAPVDNRIKKYLAVLMLEYQFHPRTQALETMNQAGEIPLLGPEVRHAILDYYALAESAKDREKISNSQIQNKYEVLIMEEFPEVFQRDNEWTFMGDFYSNDPRPVTPVDPEKLKGEKRLEIMLVYRYFEATRLKEIYTDLLTASGRVLDLVGE